MTHTQYIEVGKIGSTYGIHGWLKIHSFTELGASIFQYSPWYLSHDQHSWQSYPIEAHKPHGKGFIVKLAGITTPEAAKPFANSWIAITRDQLPALGSEEYYWTDLVGLTVINQKQEVLGTVAYLLETGSNDVIVVKGQKEIAIPYLLHSVIISIDLAAKQIIVNWEV